MYLSLFSFFFFFFSKMVVHGLFLVLDVCVLAPIRHAYEMESMLALLLSNGVF